MPVLRICRACAVAVLGLLLLPGMSDLGLAQTPSGQTLNGMWQVSLDDGEAWQPIQVPGTIEDQVDPEFDGISIYRKTVPATKPDPGHRWFLRCEGVATEATVSVNGTVIGQHLGGWTEFELPLPPDAAGDDSDWTVEIRCDERVGHNTQGFLPVFAPHFGGIWKSVELIQRSELSIHQAGVGVQVDPQRTSLNLEVPFATFPSAPVEPQLQVSIRKRGSSSWAPLGRFPIAGTMVDANSRRVVRLEVPLVDPSDHSVIKLAPWSPANPELYEIQLACGQRQNTSDVAVVSFGVRDFRAEGGRLMLNGSPVSIRGLLNWGYAPPSNAPDLNPDVMRREIQIAKSRGFNTMKFCLWIPPKPYLQLCDEMGMLAWIEYPTWHPDFTPRRLAELKSEYDEFFEYDRNHPCVVLRSLTCETGPGADIEVIRELYKQCKTRIPGAVVEDDSSWIAWNRVHDFYDDHPYGNNHTWPETLAGLRQFIAERDSKPLVLGEAIAADTWARPQPLLDQVGHDRPFWLPQYLDAAVAWEARLRSLYDDTLVDQLYVDSLRYSRLTRKYQIEAYRRDVPEGGFVVSVIRDIPFCAMGVLDYLDQEKQPASDWSWHRDHMVLLRTPNDQRSFYVDDRLKADLSVTVVPPLAGQASLEWELVRGDATLARGKSTEAVNPACQVEADFGFSIDRPEPVTLQARLMVDSRVLVQNEWTLWLVPRPIMTGQRPLVRTETCPELPERLGQLVANGSVGGEGKPILITSRIGGTELQAITDGADLLLLANNQAGSFPLKSHWFLRGGPVIRNGAWTDAVPHEFLVELQHFDLAGDVVPEIQSILSHVDPWLAVWDNHDLKQVNTHGVVFRLRLDNGTSILVTSANHFRTPAGQYLFAELVNSIQRWPQQAASDLTGYPLERLAQEVTKTALRLDQLDWKFKPDPEHAGVENNWQRVAFDDSAWSNIRTDRHWEGQGYDTLDNWAWYRLSVKLPADWPPTTFLNFTGVDDHYRVYVNGTFVGQSGDIENKLTAFDERKSYDISRLVQPGKPMQISVEVYDWYGAGGIFRPVSLSSQAVSDQPPLLK